MPLVPTLLAALTPQEFDLYKELAGLPTKRLLTGAGGISAVNYKNGRKIVELAAESGLCSIAAGLESISDNGQKQSGAWRKTKQARASKRKNRR